jgi:hypothetical protein
MVLVGIPAWMLSDLAAGLPAIGFWNVGMAFISYALFAGVLSKLRTLVGELDRRVQERTAALQIIRLSANLANLINGQSDLILWRGGRLSRRRRRHCKDADVALILGRANNPAFHSWPRRPEGQACRVNTFV